MDLNLLYSQHQREIIRARTAISRLARTKHLAAAGLYAHRIHVYQVTLGAAAAFAWSPTTGSAFSSMSSGLTA